MVKTRLIPTLQLKNWGLVKSKQFSSWRPIGPAVVAGRVYNARGVDELIALDIAGAGTGPSIPLLGDLADQCFMPFTAGGGIRTREHVLSLLRAGADKISVNSLLHQDPATVRSFAEEFGSQCVVASIDARRIDGGWMTYVDSGSRETGRGPVEFAREAVAAGVGELLLTSMDQDGTMEGYDIELVKAVTQSVNVPVIACGGAGKPEDFVAAIQEGGADAVSAASIFHFTQHTPNDVKRHMASAGIDVRL